MAEIYYLLEVYYRQPIPNNTFEIIPDSGTIFINIRLKLMLNYINKDLLQKNQGEHVKRIHKIFSILLKMKNLSEYYFMKTVHNLKWLEKRLKWTQKRCPKDHLGNSCWQSSTLLKTYQYK